MRRLPSSPSRAQALIEIEPLLQNTFQQLLKSTNAEVRDAMHYALFNVADRFCVSAAWLVAPRLGVSTARFAPVACALETLRCSLDFKLRPSEAYHRFVEPAIAEAAAYGLIPLAFEMLLTSPTDALSLTERAELGAILARAASPVHVLSALHREERVARQGHRHSLSPQELRLLQQEKITPAFEAAGEALRLLARKPKLELGAWFKRLGLFEQWVGEFTAPPSVEIRSPLALREVMSPPEAMDQIKSLESELLGRAKDLGIRDAAHDIIEPLAETLKAQLQ